MTVSHLTRTRDQLWSDLLVALGGSEAFLTRSLSERKILLEILETYGSSVSLLTIDDVDALLAAVVNAAGGSASHLRQNKHEMLATLVTALGGTAPSATSSSTGELLAACVNAADTGGGGGGVPEWVPTDAKIFIDIVNDRAWTEADGEVAIDTLLGADANTENAWGTSAYDPALLDAEGYAYGATFPAFIGGLRSLVLAGATTRIAIKSGGGGNGFHYVLAAADGNDAIEVYVFQLHLNISSWNGSLNIDTADAFNDGGMNAAAITLVSDRIDVALNGSDAVTSAVASDDRPAGNPFVAAFIALDADAGNRIQSITIYDALPSTAGLSELSETGVTNTAPHSIVVESWTGHVADGEISEAYTSVITGLGDAETIGRFEATDDEGNPIAFSLTDDAGGKFVEGTPSEAGIFKVFLQAPLTHAGNPTVSFTIRATDPGGLYVEQEFTITVTA